MLSETMAKVAAAKDKSSVVDVKAVGKPEMLQGDTIDSTEHLVFYQKLSADIKHTQRCHGKVFKGT